MIRLILASASPHRLQLLRDASYDVSAMPTAVQEPDLAGCSDVGSTLAYAAQLKAQAARLHGGQGLILGADTVGLVAGRAFGKPRDRSDARRMLAAISGTTHEVLTGWCLLRTRDGLSISGVERTAIEMRPWREQELSDYLDSEQWVGKSGAYGLEWPGDPFVTRLTGSTSNVIGVPLERLAEVLAEFPSLI